MDRKWRRAWQGLNTTLDMSKNIHKKKETNVPDELHDLLGKMKAHMTDASLLTESFGLLEGRLHDSVKNLPESQAKMILKIAVHAIRTHPEQTALALMVCKLVSKLCENESARECVVQEHGMEAITTVMQRNPSEEEVQQVACKMIYSASSSALTLPSTTLEAVMQALLNAVKLHRTNDDLLIHSMGVVALIGTHMEGAAAEKAVRMVMECMRAPPCAENVYMQSAGCMAVWALAEAEEQDAKSRRMHNIKALWEHGALQAFLSAFHLFLRDASPVMDQSEQTERIVDGFHKGCFTIEQMFKNKGKKVQEPGEINLNVILCVMNKYMHSASLQSAGFGALCSAMMAVDHRVKIGGKLAAMTLMSGMAAHHGHAQLQREVFNMLANVAYVDSDGKNYIISDKSLETFLKHMHTFLSDGDMQRHVMGLFKRLAGQCERHVNDAMVKAGCAQAIVMAVQRHKDTDHQVVHVACETLARTVSYTSSEARRLMIKQGTVDALMDAFTAGRHCEELVEFLVMAIYGLMHEIVGESIAAGVKTLPTLVGAMLRHSKNLTIQTMAFHCLFLLFQSAGTARMLLPCQKMLADCGGIIALARWLETMQRNNDVEDYQETFALVELVVRDNSKHQAKCVEDGITARIMCLMDAYVSNCELQICAFMALGSICSGNTHTQDMLTKQGGLERMQRACHIQKNAKKKADMLCMLPTLIPGPSKGQPHAHNQSELAATDLQQAAAGPPHRPHDANQSKIQTQARTQTQTQTQTMCPYSESAKKKNRLFESCLVCGKMAQELGMEKMLKCSACTIRPSYCCAECQRAHWGTHKSECKANKKGSK